MPEIYLGLEISLIFNKVISNEFTVFVLLIKHKVFPNTPASALGISFRTKINASIPEFRDLLFTNSIYAFG